MVKRISDRSRRDEGGFTLIELLVVIVILAVLSAVVVFAIRGSGDKGSSAALATDAKTVRTAEEAFCGRYGRYASADDLVRPPEGAGFLSELPTLTQPVLRSFPSASGGAPCGTPPMTFEIACVTGRPGCGANGTSATMNKSIGSLSPAPLAADTNRRLGDKMTAMNADINNDGKNDVWASVERDPTGAPAIYALSGADLAQGKLTSPPLYTITGNTSFSYPMSRIDGVGLATGDLDTLTASVYDTATGQKKFDLVSQDQFFWGWIGSAGDSTGDGKSEIAVGSTPDGDAETVAIFNGADGSHIRTITNFDGATSIKSGLLQSPGDVDGDGKADLLVGAGGFNQGKGRAFLFSGADGSLLMRIDNPTGQQGGFGGYQEVAPNTPGTASTGTDNLLHADFYIGAPSQSGAVPYQGRAWVFDGAKSILSGNSAATRVAKVKYEVMDPQPVQGNGFGVSAAAALDTTTNQRRLIVGAEPAQVTQPLPNAPKIGSASIFDANNGNVVAPVDVSNFRQGINACGSEPNGANIGRSVAAPGDLTGDGKLDFLVAANLYNTLCDLGQNPNARDQGVIIASVSE